MDISEKTIIKLLPFESAVLDMIVKDETLSAEDGVILKQQMKEAIIISRKMTGVGFFTDFQINEGSPHFNKQTFTIGNKVRATIPGIEYGVGFVLFIEKGVVKTLEGFTNADTWPDPWPNNEEYKVFDEQ